VADSQAADSAAEAVQVAAVDSQAAQAAAVAQATAAAVAAEDANPKQDAAHYTQNTFSHQ
jgi:hypothetical protein